MGYARAMHDDFPAQLAAFRHFAYQDKANAAIQMKPVSFRPLTVAMATNVRYHWRDIDNAQALGLEDQYMLEEVLGA